MPSCEPEADPGCRGERVCCLPATRLGLCVAQSTSGCPQRPQVLTQSLEEPESSPEPSAGGSPWRASPWGREPGAVLAQAVLPAAHLARPGPLFQTSSRRRKPDHRALGLPRQESAEQRGFQSVPFTSRHSRCRLGGPQGLGPAAAWARG